MAISTAFARKPTASARRALRPEFPDDRIGEAGAPIDLAPPGEDCVTGSPSRRDRHDRPLLARSVLLDQDGISMIEEPVATMPLMVPATSPTVEDEQKPKRAVSAIVPREQKA